MKIVDANILVFLTNTRAVHHVRVKSWWDAALLGDEPIGLCWAGILGFVRISTHLKIFARPLSVDQAADKVTAWLGHPSIRIVHETTQHAQIFTELLRGLGIGGNWTTDAHFAALAISHNATLVSCDTDFSRFRRLRWENPLAVP